MITLPANRNQGINSRPSLAVIIPTKNGASWLEQLLSMLKKQTFPPEEIILIDSSSTDTTHSIAKKYQAKFLSIPACEFDHGGTRNLAILNTSAEITIFMTQDAIPANQYAIEHLVRPLQNDTEQKIAAVYGRQLPNSEATIFAEHLRVFNYGNQSFTRCWQDRHAYGFKTIFISNSFAAYRKSVLEKIGYFPENHIFGEDACAVAALLEHGYHVAYASDATVFHSHNYCLRDEFRRYFDIGVFHACRSDLLEKFGTPEGSGRQFVHSELFFIWKKRKYFKMAESLLRNLAKFIAYRLGKRYKILPLPIAKKISMQRQWWE